jgi:hypothetical protein
VHVVVGRSPRAVDETMAIDGIAVSSYGAQVGSASRIVDLEAPGSFEESFALADGAVYYLDLGGAEQGSTAGARRLRRADVTWTPQ